MIFKNGQKIVFAGDSVTDDGRARPVGEGLWDALGNGYVKLIDTFFFGRLSRTISALRKYGHKRKHVARLA